MEKKKTGKIFKDKGYYLALGVMALAIGIAVTGTVTHLDTADENESVADNPSKVISNEPVAENIESEIEYSSDMESAESEETDNQTIEISSSLVEVESDTSVAAGTQVSGFVLPVDGNISKDFSLTELQYSETFRDMRLHTGIDIITGVSSPVKSAADGTVKSVENNALWGYTVTVDHSGGLVGIYSGLGEDIKVSAGDSIKMGTVIGQTESVPCECLDEPHLHFAMKKDGEWVSPLDIMAMR